MESWSRVQERVEARHDGYMLIIPVLRGLRQKDYEVEVSLDYTGSTRPAWVAQ